MPSTEEIEAEDFEEDSAIAQIKVTEVVSIHLGGRASGG